MTPMSTIMCYWIQVSERVGVGEGVCVGEGVWVSVCVCGWMWVRGMGGWMWVGVSMWE